jgi:hypothetical protein
MTSSFLNGLKLGVLGLTVALSLGSSGLAKEQLNFVVIFTDGSRSMSFEYGMP